MKSFFNLSFLFILMTAKAQLAFATPIKKRSAEELYISRPISEPGLFPVGIEGPAVDTKGQLYVVNFKERGTIGIVRPGKKPELWLTLPKGSIGNSIRFNKEGRMFVADYKGHNVFSIDTETKQTEILFHEAEMNQPNDMSISSQNIIFLSDPNWKNTSKGAIWIYSRQQALQKAASQLGAVNGIDLHPTESKIFFSESISGSIFSMTHLAGVLSQKKLFHQFEPDTVDGIRFDSAGNLFVARIQKGKIDILSPQGQLIRSVALQGQNPTNLAFGGVDGRTVYVTVRDHGTIESFRSEYPGREWILQNRK